MADSQSGYQVGPGRPPLHTRFQKGQSGNPGGRSKRRAEKRERIPPFSEAYSLACRTIAAIGFRVERSFSRSTC